MTDQSRSARRLWASSRTTVGCWIRSRTPARPPLTPHPSRMPGLCPGGHGLHENGRSPSPAQPLAAERLKTAGYRTAAFVSAFALARRFGLARGFDVYDDAVPEPRNERSARD